VNNSTRVVTWQWYGHLLMMNWHCNHYKHHSSSPSTALTAGGIPYQVQTIVLMYHIHWHQCPDYLGIIVSATATSRPGLRSANSDMYKMPRLKTVLGEWAFSHAGPAIWNSLPASIQASTNTTAFCRLLKTHFLKSSFYLVTQIIAHQLYDIVMSAVLCCKWTLNP